MTWFRVDDGFGTHRKVDALGADQPLAVACWLMVGVACARDLTDGVVTRAALARTLALWAPKDRDRAVSALVRVGLWEPSGDGWAYHDWTDHQPTRTEVEAKRDSGKLRQQRSRERRVTSAVTRDEGVTDAVTPPSVTGDRGVSHSDPSRPVPTRPDPTRPETPPIHRSGSQTRAPAPTRATAPTPARPPPSGDVSVPVVEAVWAEWRRVFGRVPAAGSVPTVSGILLGRLGTPTQDERRTAERCRALLDQAPANGELVPWTRRAVAAFHADEYAASNGWPFALFAARAGEFAARSAVTPNHVPDDFSDVPSLESRFGPEV